MEIEVRQIEVKEGRPHHASLQEGSTDVTYTKDRVGSLKWVKRLSILVIFLAITQIVVASLHLTDHKLALIIAAVATGVVSLGEAIFYYWWANRSSKAYRSSGELFQPRVNDRMTRYVFLSALFLGAAAIVVGVNLVVQRSFSADYALAQTTFTQSWSAAYGDQSHTGILQFFKVSFIILATFQIFFIAYFFFVSRTAFQCLKWDNQTMSHTVFIGSILTLAFGLGLVYYAHHALGYTDYPQIRAHFPMWNLKSLFLVGFALAALSLLGFLVDHRSWRIGFLVLGFLLLFALVLLVNFTAFAFRHTRSTYQYYNGTGLGSSAEIASTRLYNVDEKAIEDFGCPAKYITPSYCSATEQVTRWESYDKTSPSSNRTQETAGTKTSTGTSAQTSTSKSGTNGTEAAPVTTNTTTTTTVQPDGTSSSSTTTSTNATKARLAERVRSERMLVASNVYCLNPNCHGLNGQLYARDLLSVANFGLLSILAGLVVLIGCGYFWYVNWIDTARNKARDYYYLAAQLVLIVGFLVFYFGVPLPYVKERVSSSGAHTL